MDKNLECKIVQDLLLNYHDDVLNKESKDLVENHIKTCEKCKEKLLSIRTELDNAQIKEEHIVNYMKKFRRKGLIKSILIAFFIILFFATTLLLREYVKINDFVSKRDKTLQSNNIYSERRDIGNEFISIFRNYYKDGKQKEVVSLYTDSGEQISMTFYKSSDSTTELVVRENSYDITKMQKAPEEISLKIESNYFSNVHSLQDKLLLLKNFKFQEDEMKLYWVVVPRDSRAPKMEIWINRSTGLIEKEIYYNIIESYFNGSNILKNMEEKINGYIYFYDFDIVTDNDVQKTD